MNENIDSGADALKEILKGYGIWCGCGDELQTEEDKRTGTCGTCRSLGRTKQDWQDREEIRKMRQNDS